MMTENPIDNTVIYKALGKVLAALEVRNDGTLPGNMGGKGYRTAEGISNAVKELFVKNKIIAIPVSTTHNTEPRIVESGNRSLVFQNVTITWHLISTENGSSVPITGTGDGTAVGTAVAANIATTNALKNALRATFLISDQAAEEEGMKGVSTEPSKGQSAVEKAKAKPAAKAPATPSKPPASAPKAPSSQESLLRDRVRTEFIETNKVPKTDVNAWVKKYQTDGLQGDPLWQAVLDQCELETSGASDDGPF